MISAPLKRFKNILIKISISLLCAAFIVSANDSYFLRCWDKNDSLGETYVSCYEFELTLNSKQGSELASGKLKICNEKNKIQTYLICSNKTFLLDTLDSFEYKKKKAKKIDGFWFFPFNRGEITLYDTKPYIPRGYQISYFSFNDSIIEYSRESLDYAICKLNKKYSIKKLKRRRLIGGFANLALGSAFMGASIYSRGEKGAEAGGVFGFYFISFGIGSLRALRHLDKDAVFRCNRHYDF